MESNNNLQALSVVDAQFAHLQRQIDVLDQLSDRLQVSKERLADLDGEIAQIKSDDSLERSKRISRLTSLNSAKELAAGDDSKIVAAIVTAKARTLESGRAARALISSVLFQLSQTRKMNATLMLEKHFEIRKIPLRLADLANAAKGVVELRGVEELLTQPLHGREQEIGALYTLKTRFQPIREACLSEENLALELRTAAPAVAEPATTELVAV